MCHGGTALLDVVDFNKSCEEARGKFLPLSGEPVYYRHCGRCGFCFAPSLMAWAPAEFERRIYNQDYARVDPDYLDVRPRANAANVAALFGAHRQQIVHLDFGGGDGLLSRLLREGAWNSRSWDPFADKAVPLQSLGQFDLVTAFEVFEHVPDVPKLMRDLKTVLAPNGLLLFSTLVSDGELQPGQRLTWWYAAPRNGHISLFSKESLALLARREGLVFGSFSPNLHVFFRQVPPWAAHLLRTAPAP